MYEYELKIQSLLERIGSLTTEYENKVADLRVQYTVLNKNFEEYKKEIDDALVSAETVDTTPTTSTDS